MCCLDLQDNWERTTLFYEYGAIYPKEFTTVHPVKLSYQANEDRVREVFNSLIY